MNREHAIALLRTIAARVTDPEDRREALEAVQFLVSQEHHCVIRLPNDYFGTVGVVQVLSDAVRAEGFSDKINKEAKDNKSMYKYVVRTAQELG